MKKISILLSFIVVYMIAAEPSAFEAGDLDVPNPYGLTSSEKIILKNKQKVKALSTNISFVKNELNNMQEKIDGIKSVVEAQNSRIHKIEQKIIKLKQSDANSSSMIDELKNDINTTKETMLENNKKVKLVLSELSSLIDSINTSYISKDFLEERLKRFKEDILKEFNQKRNMLSKKGSVIFAEAKKSYFKKEYKKAAELFKISIKKRYMPATSNFYLGEISYKTKHYVKAIEYYKKSISLYDKASFTPTLLYHTYLSFKKLGDKKNAKKFKAILLERYPKSKAAKLLKK